MTTNQPKPKAVLYCRVSSREQEETGYSLDSQEKLLKEHADKRKLTVVKIFSMAESASGAKQRKVFDEMIKFTEKNKVTNILCEKVDRLTRNLKDALAINDWLEANEERQIHFVKQNLVIHKNAKSDEKFRWDIEIVLAKKYVTNLSEEVKKGQKEKIAQGGLPAKPLIGYKCVGEKGHKIHAPNEAVAFHIKKMFELYATGDYSLKRLEKEFYDAGLRNTSGKMLLKSRIYNLLQDPFYIGKIRWLGEVYPGTHEPLVARDVFDKVQLVLRRQMKNPKYQKHNALFKSKIFCEGCGGMVTWYQKKGNWYGHCNNSTAFKNCPQKTGIREDRVELQLIDIFDSIAPKDERVLSAIEDILRSQHSEQITERENDVNRINGLLQGVRTKKDKLYEAKINHEAPAEFFERKIGDLITEEEALESALVRCGDKNDEYLQLGVAVHELAYKAREIYEKANNDEKRLLFSQVFTNLQQNRLEIRRFYTDAAQLLVEWVPKLNKDYELLKTQVDKGKEMAFATSSPVLRRGRDSNSRYLAVWRFSKPLVSTTHAPLRREDTSRIVPFWHVSRSMITASR